MNIIDFKDNRILLNTDTDVTGNIYSNCINGNIYGEKAIVCTVVAHHFIEYNYSQGFLFDGDIRINGGITGNIIGNAFIQQNANVAGKLFVAGNLMCIGHADIVGDTRIDGNIRIAQTLTVDKITLDSYNLNGTIKYLLEKIDEQQLAIANLHKQVESLKNTTFRQPHHKYF